MAIQSVEREALLLLIPHAYQISACALKEGVKQNGYFYLQDEDRYIYLLGMRTDLGVGVDVVVFGFKRPERLNDPNLPFATARYAVLFTDGDTGVKASLLSVDGNSGETYVFTRTGIVTSFVPTCIAARV
jgi:hypothetical protein